MTVLVEDRHRELDDVDAALEARNLLRRGSGNRRGDEGECDDIAHVIPSARGKQDFAARHVLPIARLDRRDIAAGSAGQANADIIAFDPAGYPDRSLVRDLHIREHLPDLVGVTSSGP